MTNMATFYLNIFSISHLQNLSSYEIVYSRKPPAMSDLWLEKDDLTHPPFYHFTDYFDFLNEWIHTLRDMVKVHHSQTIEKQLLRNCLESPSLRSFNEVGIVYCHFPSKIIIPRHNLLIVIDRMKMATHQRISMTHWMTWIGVWRNRCMT